MKEEFDPILLQILWSRLISIAQEQAKTLIRASFTTVVGEMEDLATGIYDEQGNIMSQGVTGTQGVLIGMTRGVKAMLNRFPSQTLCPGDVIASNDPWLFSGHKYDITVATPIFLKGKMVALAATILHGSDVGGINSPGDSSEVYEEGLQIPIMKLFEKGKRNQALFEIIESNVRIPDQVIGDLLAQVAANAVSGGKVLNFMREYKLKSLLPLSRAIVTRTEQAVKKAVREIPDGVYRHENFCDGIDEPLKVACALKVKGSDLTVDFTGTSPQTEKGGINAVYNFTFAYTLHAIKSALVPDLPNNEGLFRSIKVVAPEGCLVNPRFPAPVMARYMMVNFISGPVFGALAKAIPERVIADSGGFVMALLSGIDLKGKRFVYWLTGSGGMGARPGKDGIEATCFPANVGNVPVEIIENVSPAFVVKREFITDSAGPGKYRGGCDQAVTVKVRGNKPAVLHSFYERTKFPALGFRAGREGKPGQLVVNEAIRPHPKQKYTLFPGDQVTYSEGGGGGYGPPHEREPEKVLWDVINGYVSKESAERDYKVFIDVAKKTIDWEKTKQARAAKNPSP